VVVELGMLVGMLVGMQTRDEASAERCPTSDCTPIRSHAATTTPMTRHGVSMSYLWDWWTFSIKCH